MRLKLERKKHVECTGWLKVSPVFSGFDKQEKGLGVVWCQLNLPFHDCLDKNPSHWLLKNLEFKAMTIKTPSGDILAITHVDVQRSTAWHISQNTIVVAS